VVRLVTTSMWTTCVKNKQIWQCSPWVFACCMWIPVVGQWVLHLMPVVVNGRAGWTRVEGS